VKLHQVSQKKGPRSTPLAATGGGKGRESVSVCTRENRREAWETGQELHREKKRTRLCYHLGKRRNRGKITTQHLRKGGKNPSRPHKRGGKLVPKAREVIGRRKVLLS